MERKEPYRVKWSEERIQQVYELALLGATDKQMAKVMGVEEDTFSAWKRNKPEFLESLLRGKMAADAKVAASLYKKACGYDYYEERAFIYRGQIIKETVKKHSPIDAWAASKWLAMRQKELWTDVQRVESTQTNINVMKLDFSGLSTDELQLVRKLQLQQLTKGVGDN